MAKRSKMGGLGAPFELAHRISRKLRREARALFRKSRDHLRPSYPDAGSLPDCRLAHRFGFLDPQFIDLLIRDFPNYPELVQQQAEQSIAHCFDLLGSGPQVVKHGSECRGLEGCRFPASPEIDADRRGNWLDGRINRANLPAAKHIWQQVGNGYQPIDWHLDFKSGYRWQESIWYGDIRFGHLPGVDIKVPWELSRMQHLPTLALACHFAKVGARGFRLPEFYVGEFRNQALDFFATNPPAFGVNWACAMDVGIRVANLLLAYDIIAASGLRLDDEFEKIFAASVKAHARHIAANLEWSPQVRGNHYIANIVGLLFAAVYLPSGDEVDAWLALAVQELISEVAYQFHEDGSNFEASVCYHRLSSEMVLWASALLANLAPDKRAALSRSDHQLLRTTPPLRREMFEWHRISGTTQDSPIPEWLWVRLARMANFSEATTRPDGLVVQFGDNDSGRFIILGSGEQLRAGNNPNSPLWSLDHGALIAGIRSLIGRKIPATDSKDDPGARMLSAIMGARDDPSASIISNLANINQPKRSKADDSVWIAVCNKFAEAPPGSRWKSVFDAGISGLLNGIDLISFPGMGCYVIKGPRLYLAVRCGEIGLAGLGGHAHCDQLAIELVIDGESRVRDPGTYIYTPLPAKRNAYRSSRAHYVPRVPSREPADLTRGMFDLRGGAVGECLYFGTRGFIGRHSGYGLGVYRIISLEDTRIVIHDFADGNLTIADPTPDSLPYSYGYGRVTAG
jgi:hypothetical protein